MKNYNNHLAVGLFSDFKMNENGIMSAFGGADYNLPSSFGDLPYIMMPYGPGGQWLVEGHEANASGSAPSSNFGRCTTKGCNSFGMPRVTPAGYLSIWGGEPRVAPPSWNPLLLQGQNIFAPGINYPSLSDVTNFGRKRKSKGKTSKKSRSKKSTKTRKGKSKKCK